MKGHISQGRQLRRLAAAALLGAAVVAACGAVGCFVDVTLEGAHLSCNADGRCPDGYSCVQGRCLVGAAPVDDGGVEPGDPDAGEGEADGAPPADAEGSPDGALLDAPPPDAPVLLTCDQLYSIAPGYVLCTEEADRCTFFVEEVDPTPFTSCDQDCSASGGACISAQDSDGDPKPDPEPDPKIVCTPLAEVGCDAVLGTKICTCTRVAPQ